MITEVRLTPAPEHMVPRGMLGWASFLIDGRLHAGGVAVRRSLQGRVYLSYPSRDDGWGRRWDYLKPIDDETRREIERQVLEQLGEAVQ